MARTEEEGVRWFARSANRAWIHAGLLLTAALAVMVLELSFGLGGALIAERDKLQHYRVGRVAASIVFLLMYSCIVARVLLAGKGSVTRMLLWIPTCLAGGLLLAVGVAALLAFGKEALDMGGLGVVDWEDVAQTLKGALTLAPAVSLVMALTPLLIPLDLLLQIPRFARTDLRTGVRGIDSYLTELQSQKQEKQPPVVLLVEDDIACATVALNFCRNLRLPCRHVSSIPDANWMLERHGETLRLILLDNYVRVDQDSPYRTGSDWAKIIAKEYPPDTRSFRIVMTSGFADQLGDLEHVVELILQKPWNPKELVSFLQREGILSS